MDLGYNEAFIFIKGWILADLRDEILQKVRDYYHIYHEANKGDKKIHYAGRIYDENELVNLVDSALDFWLTAGKYAKEFESKLARYLGAHDALMVNSGSSANLLAFFTLTSPLLKDRAIKRGDEVITIAASFPTTISPIVQFGAVPVFVDVDLSSANIDTATVEQAISKKTKAIFVAHTLGNPFDIKAIKEICSKFNLWLIEDNCDALGAKYDGKFTGTFGDIGTSSFYPAHHITMGEGGAIYTNNPLLKKIALSMRDWGRDCHCIGGKDNTCGARFSQAQGKLPFGYDHKYIYSHFGYNLKATEMQASIGVAQLDKLDFFIKRRRENHQYLSEKLSRFDDVFILPKAMANAKPSWFGFLLTLRDGVKFSRNEIVQYLESNHIQTRNLFAGNMLLHPAFDNLNEGVDYRVVGSLKNTNKIMRDSFWIGVYPGISSEDIDYISDIIGKFMGGGLRQNLKSYLKNTHLINPHPINPLFARLVA